MRKEINKLIFVILLIGSLFYEYYGYLKNFEVNLLFLILMLFLCFCCYCDKEFRYHKCRTVFICGILFVLIFYQFLNNLSLICYGYSVNEMTKDIFYVVMASTEGEIRAFLFNFFSLPYLKSLLLFSPFVFFYLGDSIESGFYVKGKIADLVFLSFVIASVLLFLNPKFAVNEFFYTLNSVVSSNSFDDFAERKKNFKWNAESSVKGKSTVVVILGESTRGNHMSLNGYTRKTTPLLEQQDLISFTNAISNGVHTLVGTPFILTRKPLDERYIYTSYPEKSFISAYKEAGYKTYYISYEKNVVVGDSVINQYVSEADEYIWRPSEPDHNEDSNGIEIIKDILNRSNSDKNLIVYKLAGSHVSYKDRYPMMFDVFKPSFKTIPYVNISVAKKDIMVNTYDNTILHTDYVVSSIIDELKKCRGEAMLTFISDHGATLFEDGKSCGYSYLASQYNIPYFFWFNDDCVKRLGKDKVDILSSNRHKPVDQTYFIDTLHDASGIVTSKRVGKTLFENIDNIDDRMVIVSYKFVPYSTLSDN